MESSKSGKERRGAPDASAFGGQKNWRETRQSGHLSSGFGYPEPELVQLLLHCQINGFFSVDFGRFVALHFEHGGHYFPACFATMDFEAVLHELARAGSGSGDRHEDPFVMLQTMQGLEFSVRNTNRMGVVIHRVHPWLFAHGPAGVIEKDPKLISTDDGPHAGQFTLGGRPLVNRDCGKSLAAI